MDQDKFIIEELEERIAPSSMALGAPQPGADASSAPAPMQGGEPEHWHPLWPVDPWPPQR